MFLPSCESPSDVSSCSNPSSARAGCSLRGIELAHAERAFDDTRRNHRAQLRSEVDGGRAFDLADVGGQLDRAGSAPGRAARIRAAPPSIMVCRPGSIGSRSVSCHSPSLLFERDGCARRDEEAAAIFELHVGCACATCHRRRATLMRA